MSAGASRQAAQGRQQPASIVVTVADAPKGQVPLGFLVLKAGVARPAADVEREAVALVRERIVPVASFKAALVVAGLPKTRSGKILRSTMRKIADGEDYPMPATIDDPAVLGPNRGDAARVRIRHGGRPPGFPDPRRRPVQGK